MLRVAVRNMLNQNPAIRGALTGGIYPETDDDATVMDPKFYPKAWAASGDMLPTALVQDYGLIPVGPHRNSYRALVRILFWQQRGRAAIETAMHLARIELRDRPLSLPRLYIYRFEDAGDGEPVQDAALRNAEHNWQTWQAPLLTKG